MPFQVINPEYLPDNVLFLLKSRYFFIFCMLYGKALGI